MRKPRYPFSMRGTFWLGYFALFLAASVAVARCAFAQTARVLPDGHTVVATLAKCTTACPDSTAVRYVAQGISTLRMVKKPRTADSLYFSTGATAFTVQVFFTKLSATSRTVTIPAGPVVPVPPDTQPTPPPSGSFTPNLPPGLSLIVDTRLSMAAPGLQIANWSNPPSCSNGTDPRGVVLRQTYPGNSLGNGTGGCGIIGPENQSWKHIYFAMEVWFSPDYSLHSGAEKWFYGYPTLIEFVLDGNETPNGPTFGLELMPVCCASADDWIHYPATSKRVRKGVWQTIEVELNQSGTYKAWIDGDLVVSKTGVRFSGTFPILKFDGTRGGGASNTPTPPQGQERRYGRLAFYAK